MRDFFFFLILGIWNIMLWDSRSYLNLHYFIFFWLLLTLIWQGEARGLPHHCHARVEGQVSHLAFVDTQGGGSLHCWVWVRELGSALGLHGHLPGWAAPGTPQTTSTDIMVGMWGTSLLLGSGEYPDSPLGVLWCIPVGVGRSLTIARYGWKSRLPSSARRRPHHVRERKVLAL